MKTSQPRSLALVVVNKGEYKRYLGRKLINHIVTAAHLSGRQVDQFRTNPAAFIAGCNRNDAA